MRGTIDTTVPASGPARLEPPDTRGAPGLPGPPGSPQAPPPLVPSSDRSSDPGPGRDTGREVGSTEEVEDRLFRTDGGRMVLKAIRAHGGWERFRKVKRITGALLSPEPAPPEAGAPLAGGAAGPAAGGPRSFAWTAPPGGASTLPGDIALALLTAPFWLADPELDLEYLGVEADASSGESYDKVRASPRKQGPVWFVAYVSRRTGLLDRLLFPQGAGLLTGRSTSRFTGRFTRVDLAERRDLEGGLILATRWISFSLRDRYARADLEKPERDERLSIALDAPGDSGSKEKPQR